MAIPPTTIVIASNCKSVQLRSERDETKNGRVYAITLRVADSSGNVAHADFKVTVPLNQSGAPAIEDTATVTTLSNCQGRHFVLHVLQFIQRSNWSKR